MSLGNMDLIAGKLTSTFRKPTPAPTIENDDDFKISYAFQNLDEIDERNMPKNPEKVLVLDLTENNFNGSNDLRFLIDFTSLKTLILDKNCIQSNFTIPFMENLRTLWVNHNNIVNLSIFVENLSRSCPNLTYLSMINNKAAPSYFNGGTLIEYHDYRLYVISKLEKLQMLDHKEVAPEERLQSKSIYGSGSAEKLLKRKKSSLKTKNNPAIQKRPTNPEKRELEKKVSSQNTKEEIDYKNENKSKNKKKEKCEKSLKVIETDKNNNFSELLPDLLQIENNVNKNNELYLEQSNQITDAYNNVDNQLLPEISDPHVQDASNRKKSLEFDEGEFIQNELEMLSIREAANEGLINQQLPECIPPPSPSLSLIIDIESLPNPNEIAKNINLEKSEQNYLNESLSNLLPDEISN